MWSLWELNPWWQCSGAKLGWAPCHHIPTYLPHTYLHWHNYKCKSLGVCLYKLGTSSHWDFFPILQSKTAPALSSWMSSTGVQQTKSYHRFWIGLRSGLWLGHSKTFKCFPLSHTSVALAVCLVSLSCQVNLRPSLKSLEDKQVSLKNVPVFSAIHHSFNSLPMKNIPTAWCCQHYASLWGCCSRADERCWVCATHSVFLNGKKLHFSLIWPEYLLPYVWWVSQMPFGEHQTCLLIFFFKQQLFSVHSSLKPSSVECRP